MKKIKYLRWLIGFPTIALLISMLAWSAPRNQIELFIENDNIEKAVHTYFDAEMKKDFQEIYRCLASSSVYKMSHNYQEFLEDVRDSPVRILEYKIIDIYGLRKNHDKESYPGVERFVQTEVEVIIYYDDTQNKTFQNHSFTFLKEGGDWYKG